MCIYTIYASTLPPFIVFCCIYSVRMLSTVTSSTRYMTPRGSIVRGTITSSSSIEDRVTPPLSACLRMLSLIHVLECMLRHHLPFCLLDGKNHFYQNLQFLEMPRFEEGPLNRSKLCSVVCR